MKLQANSHGEILSTHLPPNDQSLLLYVNKEGRVRTYDKVPAPYNKHGLPDPQLYLNTLAETLDTAYVPPGQTNVHHLVYPRKQYHQYGTESVQYRFREMTGLMMSISTQVHNYGHFVMEDYRMPAFDVMQQAVEENAQIVRLFKIGRAVITSDRWLYEMRQEGAQMYRTAERYERHYAPTEALFYDYLDSCSDSQVGIMPDRQSLADMGFEAATRSLGALAATRSLSFRRKAVDLVRQRGV